VAGLVATKRISVSASASSTTPRTGEREDRHQLRQRAAQEEPASAKKLP
jgi:hypothetical protein